MVHDTLIYCLYKSKMFVYRWCNRWIKRKKEYQYLVNTVVQALNGQQMTLTWRDRRWWGMCMRLRLKQKRDMMFKTALSHTRERNQHVIYIPWHKRSLSGGSVHRRASVNRWEEPRFKAHVRNAFSSYRRTAAGLLDILIFNAINFGKWSYLGNTWAPAVDW